MSRRTTKVYLAGPITGGSYGECTDWRIKIKTILDGYGYQCISPMRGKEFLKEEEELKSTGYSGIASDHSIFKRDKHDTTHTDVLLLNLYNAKQISIGSMMELAWAEHCGKFCLVIMEKENPHHHCFVLQAASLIMPDMSSAIAYLIDVYNT